MTPRGITGLTPGQTETIHTEKSMNRLVENCSTLGESIGPCAIPVQCSIGLYLLVISKEQFRLFVFEYNNLFPFRIVGAIQHHFSQPNDNFT